MWQLFAKHPNKMNTCEIRTETPPIPRRIPRGVGAVVLWVIGGLLCAHAALLFLVIMLLPAPIEPPGQMGWEEFKDWVDSGAWFWDSMKTCGKSATLGFLLVALPLVRLFRNRRQPANQAQEAIRAPGAPQPRR